MEPTPELDRCIPERAIWNDILRFELDGSGPLFNDVPRHVVEVADRLDDLLPEGWTVTVGRNILGVSPDIVCFHPKHGLLIVAVEDWGDEVDVPDSSPKSDKSSKSDESSTLPSHPVKRLQLFRKVFSQVFTRLSDSETLITTVAVLPRKSDDDALKLLGQETKGDFKPGGKLSAYEAIFGRESLQADDEKGFLGLLVVSQQRNTQRGFESHRQHLELTDRTRERLKEQLRFPELERELYSPLELDTQKRRFVENRKAVRFRKVRGSAGSGKTTLLAACAAKAVLNQQRVLVVSFTIALSHWIHPLIVRAGLNQGVKQGEFSSQVKHRVHFSYLHQFAELVALKSNRLGELNTLMSKSGKYPSEEVRLLVDECFRSKGDRLQEYDLILLDEAQNIHGDWITILKKALRPEGQMVIFHDPTQNLYSTDVSWAHEGLPDFGRDWTELHESYRFPVQIFPVLDDYLKRFHQDGEVLVPEPVRVEHVPEGLFDRVDLIHFNVSDDTFFRTAFEVLQRSGDLGYAPDDVALLCIRHKDGLKILDQIKESGCLPNRSFEYPGFVHVFHTKDDCSKHLKKAFYPYKSAKKLCTFNSYQGWQAKFVVLVITEVYENEEGDSEGDFDYHSVVYTGLSRVAKSMAGHPTLVVVNCEPTFNEFFEKHFQKGNLASATLR